VGTRCSFDNRFPIIVGGKDAAMNTIEAL